MINVVRRLAEQRERHILAHARPHLAHGERVEHWTRIRRFGTRGSGFLFVTAHRCVIAWAWHDEAQVIEWDEIDSWGFDERVRGGPVLGVDVGAGPVLVQMPIDTNGRLEVVTRLLKRFAELAPAPRRPFSAPDHGVFDTIRDVVLNRERRSVAGHTKRVAVTVTGLALVALGIALSLPLVPGPGILILLAGLALLGSEYDWAQDLMHWVRERSRRAARRLTGKS